MRRHGPENKECIYCSVEEREMDVEWKPGDDDVKTVLEAHDLLPEGPLLEEALGLTSLYADRIRELLAQLPAPSNRQKAVLAILEEGLMQEGIIPNSHERKFKMPDEPKKP
jgi:hypothetical protein